MREVWESLNNRELSVLAWGIAFLLIATFMARPHVKPPLKAFFQVKIFGVFVALAVYVTLVVLALASYKVWDASLLKDTLIWFFTVACVTVFAAVKDSQEPHFFRSIVLESIKLTAVVQFVCDTYVLPLGWELIIVPVITLIVGMDTLADQRKEHRSLRKPLKAIIATIGFGVVGYAFYQLCLAINDFVSWEKAREFMLEPALTLLTVPFFFVFAVWVVLENHFIRLSIWLKDRPDLLPSARWRSIVESKLVPMRIAKLRGRYYLDLQEAESALDVRRITREFARKPEPRLLKGEVVRNQLVPYRLPGSGQTVQMVLIDWRNISDSPVGVVFADITAYDADGNELQSGAKDYCIFSASEGDHSRVKPGEVYVEPEDQGFVLLSNAFGIADRIEVKLTRLYEEWPE